MIRVGVSGAAGRVGSKVCAAVLAADDLELVAAVDPFAVGKTVSGCDVVIAADRDAFRDAHADVVIDFTVLDVARETVRWCATNNVHAVVGTTGFGDDDIAAFRSAFEGSKAHAIIAPNFTIGALLMMRFAEMAAPWFEAAEIIEFHHANKIDAPSGTAMLTASRMGAASSDWVADPTTKVVADGARGGTVAAIPVHSVRMPGMYAHQEVILGAAGQTLTIRHDSTDVDCYMPGVVLAVRQVGQRPGLTFGLDALLDL